MNAPKGSKPWLIDFGLSMFSAPESDNLFNQKVQATACLAKHLKDHFNVGIMDYRKAENIIESYDWDWGQFKQMAPLQIVVKDGKVYQLPQKNYNVIYYAEAIKALDSAATYVDNVYAPRNELNIFWEYAKRDLGKMKWGSTIDM